MKRGIPNRILIKVINETLIIGFWGGGAIIIIISGKKKANGWTWGVFKTSWKISQISMRSLIKASWYLGFEISC